MLRLLVRRLAIAAPLLLGVSIVAFALVRLVPGDTVTAMLGPQHSEQEASILRQRYGLDRSLPAQYAIWLGCVLRGDLGRSSFTGTPVAQAIAERLPVTIELAALAVLVSLVVGVPLGAIAATRRRGVIGRAAGSVGLLGISIPGFWLGTLLVLAFALGLRWLPSSGFVPIDVDPRANLRHMVLPSSALGAAVAGVVLRTTRGALLELLVQDFVRVARAKGLGPLRIVLGHVLRPSAVPVLTALGVQAGYLLAGSVVIEQVFALPGLGRLTWQALGNRDYPLFQGCVLCIAAGFVLVTLTVDLIAPRLDPRLR